MQVVRESYPDHTSWDRASGHFDPKSTPDAPRWFMVDVKAVRRLSRFISLRELHTHANGDLQGMALLQKGRLSVQPVVQDHWNAIIALESQERPAGESVQRNTLKRK